MKFNKETILDPEVINIEGATMLLPDGWTREGGFVWMPRFSAQANLLMRVSDPNTGAAVQTLLTQHYAWSYQSSFPPMQPGSEWLGSVVLPPPSNPAECVQNVFIPGPLQHLRGARLVRSEDLRAYTAELSRAISHMNVQTTRLRYAFDWGGRGWEEDVYLIALFSPPDGWLARWWCTGWSARAPAGDLDKMTPLLAAVMLSVKNTFDWSAMLDYAQIEFALNIQRQQADRSPQRRGIIWAQTETPGSMWVARKDLIRQKHRQKFDARQPAADRERIALSQIIGGIETFIDPFNSQMMLLPSGYSDYWVSREGQVITSNDAALNPGARSTTEWRKMNRQMAGAQPGWHF